MTIDRNIIWQETKDYFNITLGLMLYTFGFTVFLLPYQIVTGGIAGIGAIIFYATKFPVQWTFFIINALLIVAALKELGIKFLTKTIYATVVITVMLDLAQKVVEQPDGTFYKLMGEGNDFMSLIIGCMLTGTALAIVFLNNGSTGGDGIKSNSTETDKGYITINGGTVNINAYADGIQAEQTFTMNGGDLNITTYQGSDFSGNASGGWGGGMGGDGNANKTDISAKGIKAVGLYDEAGTTWQSGGDLIVNGGTITIDSSDDSLHCSGDMQLLGGSMTLATADDGAHSDHALIIGSTGGDDDTPYVNITKSYEGIEGVDITQNSGTVMVTSSDDGYNAAGGSDSSGNNNNGGWGQGGWGGPGGGNSSSGSQTMTFNGGYTYVNAAGDGLDSNGNISFNGGYVFVSQTGGGNGPLDCGDSNNSITYSGGTVIAAGSSDMFETPSSYSFLSQTSVSAGQTITFTDASGNVLATFTLPNGSAEMVMCSKESSVTCYTGGTLSGTTYFASQDDTDRCGYGGTISGGTTVSASSGGNGGWGGGGNNRPF